MPDEQKLPEIHVEDCHHVVLIEGTGSGIATTRHALGYCADLRAAIFAALDERGRSEREAANAQATQAVLEWLLEDNITEFEDARWALEQMMRQEREKALEEAANAVMGMGGYWQVQNPIEAKFVAQHIRALKSAGRADGE